MNNSVLRPVLVVAALALTACSGPETATSAKSETEKAAVAPPEPVTAKTAFYAMYKPAYAWSNDILPLTVEAVESKTLPGITNDGGKAGMWTATFGSPTKRQFCKFTYAVVAAPPDVMKGVTAAEAVPWAGQTKDAMAFQSSDFSIDSDAAYQTAMEKAGPWLKDHPDIKLTTLALGAASRVPGPVWSVVWGDKKLGFFQLISASTGKALK